MSQTLRPQEWWDLHIRKARGEALNAGELRFYEEESARQDRDAPPLHLNLQEIRQVRESLADLSRTNSTLRVRLDVLQNQVDQIEQAMSQEIRETIGAKT